MLKKVVGQTLCRFEGQLQKSCVNLSTVRKAGFSAQSQSLRAKYFITGDELHDRLKSDKSSNLKIVDGTWFMPNTGIKAAEEHVKKRLTTDTVLFDHDLIIEPGINLPHTLPSLDVFKSHMVRLGIQKSHNIVCYDAAPNGMQAVARCQWMLRYFGAKNVRILDGGLKKWVEDGRSIVENQPADQTIYNASEGDYSYSVEKPATCITDINEIYTLAGKLYHASSPTALDFQIVDARSKDRFLGNVDEPRPGLRRGSIKNSMNMPFTELLNADGTFKSENELAKIFKDAGIAVDKHTVHTCGSGTTACVVDLALRLLGNENAVIYDGSWSEYGQVDKPEPKF